MRFAISLLAASLAVAVPAIAREAALPAAQVAADRFVILEGGRNFRDLGGYRTADGHVVKRGAVYRSGSLGKLTPVGQQRLAQLHVARIIDLRTTAERSSDTFDLKAAYPGYCARDYAMSQGDGRSVFSDPATLTADKVKAMMTGAYKTLPKEQAPAYRQLFAELQTAAPGPTVFNCTAGKDRTGIAAALVLTALGVPYETVRQDFLLTNGAPGMETLQADLSGPLTKLPPELAAPLIGVDGAYLDTAFAQMKADYGSVDGYLSTELGVGPREIAVLRARLLTK